MARIGVTTGCFYQLDMALQEEIDYIQDLGAEGIELSFGTADEVHETDPTDIGDLSTRFDFVTLHAPIRDWITPDANGAALLEKLEHIRSTVGATVIVVHPPKLPSLRFATDRARVAVENMQRRKGFDADDLAVFINGWNGPLVLDTCHAATWGRQQVTALFDRFGDRCHHVHLSAYGAEEHERMVEHPAFMEQVTPLVADHDIILEHRLDTRAELDEEFTFVRDHLS